MYNCSSLSAGPVPDYLLWGPVFSRHLASSAEPLHGAEHATASSVACGRLFTAGGLIFKPLRACTGDVDFEAQLLLKLNKDFTSWVWSGSRQQTSPLPVEYS